MEKTILIIAEFIGKEETAQNDAKIVDFVRSNSDGNEIHVYTKELFLNPVGEYLRMKRVKIHTSSGINEIPESFDKVVATDKWGKSVIGMFSSGGKKPVEQTIHDQEIKEAIEEKEEEKPSEIVSMNYDQTGKKIADIVIPHHNRHDLLKNLLGMIPNNIFNIHIISGKSFGKNCNKGAKIAETKNIIFLNDDIEITAEQLIKMVNTLKKYDFVGTTQLAGEERHKYWGIRIFRDTDGKVKHGISSTKEESLFPAGFCFAITRATWEKLKGFNEKFTTGNEDVDLGLRAIEKHIKMTILDLEIPHKESQSLERFRFVSENEELFYKMWSEKIEKYANTPDLSIDDSPLG